MVASTTKPLNSSPSKPRKNLHRRAASQGEELDYVTRRSFMSPTKASLARFYPNLLLPKDITELQRPSTGDNHTSDIHHSGKKTKSNGHAVSAPRAKTAEPEFPETELMPLFPLHTEHSSSTSLKRGHLTSEIFESSKRARIAVAQSGRASPPEAANNHPYVVRQLDPQANGVSINDDDTTAPNAITNRASSMRESSHPPSTPKHKALAGTILGMGQREDGEPSLPLTPVHLGLENPAEPPKGLLFSSPTLRTKLPRSPSAKSSPLKPLPTPSAGLLLDKSPISHGLGSQEYFISIARPPPTDRELTLLKMRESLALSEKQLLETEVILIRQVLVSGWQSKNERFNRAISRRGKDAAAKSYRVIQSREAIQQAECTGNTTQDRTSIESNPEHPDRQDLYDLLY